MSRETGYYRTQDITSYQLGLKDEGWGIYFYSVERGGWVAWNGEISPPAKFEAVFHVPDQTPVNPVPADEVETDIVTLISRNRDFDGAGVNKMDSLEEAFRCKKHFEDGAEFFVKVATRTTETRVVKEGE